MAAWILSCESTVDLPYRDMEQRNIPVLFYSYVVDGTAYLDDMGRDPAALPRFYQFLEEGKAPSTSQLNTFQYLEFFEPLLQQGDVLHIGFGTGMTPSVKNAEEAAQSLREKYPERKITVIVVSHSMEDMGKYAERLIVMDSGCVAYDGTPEEVFSHYKELEKIGILAPQVTYVVEGLAKKGIRLPHNAINVKQAADAILAYRKGER